MQSPDDQFLSEIKLEAQNFRGKSTEFQGLEREFAFIQNDLIQKYERSSPHRRHPADQGAIREGILREDIFLRNMVFQSQVFVLLTKMDIKVTKLILQSTTI